jgi:hypothetical protein
MNIVDYLNQIKDQTQIIFNETIKDSDAFGKAHHSSACIFEFSLLIQDKYEREMLATVSAQLESGSINVMLGLYRQAFTSLRLAFEMGLGTVYFSLNKLDHFEWMKGNNDIKWGRLIDKDSGVLSKRFSNAFFPELTQYMEAYNERAAMVYRNLSEYVHGNSGTWAQSGIVIKLNPELIKQYFSLLKSVSEIILFTLCCRYLKTIDKEHFDAIEFIPTELNHISPIRELLGGPKEL